MWNTTSESERAEYCHHLKQLGGLSNTSCKRWVWHADDWLNWNSNISRVARECEERVWSRESIEKQETTAWKCLIGKYHLRVVAY